MIRGFEDLPTLKATMIAPSLIPKLSLALVVTTTRSISGGLPPAYTTNCEVARVRLIPSALSKSEERAAGNIRRASWQFNPLVCGNPCLFHLYLKIIVADVDSLSTRDDLEVILWICCGHVVATHELPNRSSVSAQRHPTSRYMLNYLL